MKTFIPALFTALIFICSCSTHADKRSENYVLEGIINGQDSGILVLSHYTDTSYISDTAEIKKGKFAFSGKISEPTRAYLKDRDDVNRVLLYLESGEMKINLDKENFSEFKMTGSKTQDELVILNNMEKPFYDKLAMLREQNFKISDSIGKLNNGPSRLLLEKKLQEIYDQISETKSGLNSTWLKFVVEHPKSFVTPYYLNVLEANEEIALDSLKIIFSGLDKSIRQSFDGKNIYDDIRKKENISIGSLAPDFKAKDFNQQTVTLSQFKGKSVVLLDFWASWCVPCRESVPHLKSLYNQFHSRGLEIIAVSIDTNKESWINAINQDSTGMWFHVPVAEQYARGPNYITNDDIYKNYFVQIIPVTIVIDKNGKIVSRLVGNSQENEESLDKAISQLFKN